MTTRTKEEQQQLDEKIARIRKQDEEILRRKREIEEDIRLAEQQNAVVKLRQTSTNVSRERTPALKPSNRQFRDDFPEDAVEPALQRNSRGSLRGQGGQRFRGQGDWKTSGPPPDPKSFLYDDERDVPRRDREGKDSRRELDRGKRDDHFGGREFQRGGRRGGGGDFRGRRGGRGGSRSEEEAWKAERLLIDEARIQRQKGADGKWRREWDNEKIAQELVDEPRHESRRPAPSNQESWRQSQSNQPQHLQHHHHHPHHQQGPHEHHHDHQPQHECPVHGPHEHTRHIHRGGGSRGGRGRGRFDPLELEMPLENFQVEIVKKQTSPSSRSSGVYSLMKESPKQTKDNCQSPRNPPHQETINLQSPRSIECVGNTVKISIPNTNAAQSIPKSQRQGNEHRGRFKSTSYSSQSDDDSPRERGHRGGRRQRNQKAPKNLPKNGNPTSSETSFNTSSDSLPVQNKPPLPPFRTEPKPSAAAEGNEGDESWEDVTTSGTESMGEELSSVQSSPSKKSPAGVIVNSTVLDQSVPADTVEITDDTLQINTSLDQYVNQVFSDAEMGVSLDHPELDPSILLGQQILPAFNQLKLDSSDVTSDNVDITGSLTSINVSVESSANDVLEIMKQSKSLNEGTINDQILHDPECNVSDFIEINSEPTLVHQNESVMETTELENQNHDTEKLMNNESKSDLEKITVNTTPEKNKEDTEDKKEMGVDKISNFSSEIDKANNSCEYEENLYEENLSNTNSTTAEEQGSEQIISVPSIEETDIQSQISSLDKQVKNDVENIEPMSTESEKSK